MSSTVTVVEEIDGHALTTTAERLGDRGPLFSFSCSCGDLSLGPVPWDEVGTATDVVVTHLLRQVVVLPTLAPWPGERG